VEAFKERQTALRIATRHHRCMRNPRTFLHDMLATLAPEDANVTEADYRLGVGRSWSRGDPALALRPTDPGVIGAGEPCGTAAAWCAWRIHTAVRLLDSVGSPQQVDAMEVWQYAAMMGVGVLDTPATRTHPHRERWAAALAT
jgi:hypothetical protein